MTFMNSIAPPQTFDSPCRPQKTSSPTHPQECQAIPLKPWQECIQVIRNLRQKEKKQLQQQEHILEVQSEEVEFLRTNGESNDGGSINGLLFDYLADKPEPSTTQNLFSILDDGDEFICQSPQLAPAGFLM